MLLDDFVTLEMQLSLGSLAFTFTELELVRRLEHGWHGGGEVLLEAQDKPLRQLVQAGFGSVWLLLLQHGLGEPRVLVVELQLLGGELAHGAQDWRGWRGTFQSGQCFGLQRPF